MYTKPLVFVDVETTGASPTGDRIIEIAAIRVEDGKVVETLKSVIDPEKRIPEQIFAMTGIGPAEIASAPTFIQVAPKLFEILEGAVFVAHNARFDYGFIKNELKRAGFTFTASSLCTVKLSRKLFPTERRHDLSSVIERANIVCENRHRAYDDAYAMIDFLHFCRKEHGEERVKEVMQDILGEYSIPSELTSIIEKLPEQPGVYIFYGADGDMLYIGKSVNIKTRVKSHFTNDHATTKAMRMTQEIKDIEAIVTAGELSALILESHMIKERQPLYNRQLRNANKLVVAKEKIKDGYKTIEFESLGSEDIQPDSAVLGIYKSLRQAKVSLKKVAGDFELCEKLMGLEKGKGQCFYYQLKQCNGACCGKETSLEYNTRFDVAFIKRRLETWPFRSAIIIEEKSKEDSGEGIVFIIDNWQLVGSFTQTDGELAPFLPGGYVFDYDSYKILVAFMKNYPYAVKPISSSEMNRMLGEKQLTYI